VNSLNEILPLSRKRSDALPSAARPISLTPLSGRSDIDEPPNLGNLLEAFSWSARRTGAPAILAPGRASLTYESLFRQVERTGTALAAIGIGRGSRVGIALPNGPEIAVALLAVASYATAAPLDPATEEQSWRDLLRSLRLDAVIVPHAAHSPATRVAHELGLPIVRLSYSENDPAGTFVLFSETPRPAIPVAPGQTGDIAMLLRTSGTVSGPKVVPLTHAQILARPPRVLLGSSDRGICVGPLFTATALGTNLLGALMDGASVVIPPEFRAERLIDWINEFKPTYLTASSATLASLLDLTRQGGLAKPHSLRFLRGTSNALPARLQEELEQVFGIPVIQAYSMTETGAISENPLPPGVRKPGSVGLPLAEVAIASETGSFPRGVSGEIMVRGPRVMSGYENHPKANQDAFRDGWFRTGDQGYFDEDGYLFLTGRTKEFINRGGVKVSPRDIDDALLGHPAVRDAAAFAVPHPTLGEDVAAAVVLHERGSVTPRQLRDFTLERLARSKVPSRIVLVDDLKRNHAGKVRRSELTTMLGPLLRARREKFVAPRDAIEVQLMRIWEQLLGRYPVGVCDDFFDLGGDSLLATQVVDRVNQLFDRELPLDVLWHGGQTIESLATLLRDQARKGWPVWSRAVPFKANGSRQPLFCAPVEGGHLYFYDNLARHLDADQPVYGLPAQGTDGQKRPHTTVEAMAAHAIRLMREVQPVGPYSLVGYCSGAWVAFEMARQLEVQGDKVERLVLIDSVAPGINLRSWGLLALDALKGKNRRLLQERLYQMALHPLGLEKFRRLEKPGEAHRWALWSYRPGHFAGPALLIRPSYNRSSRDAALGWRRLVRGGVEVRTLTGSHGALVTVQGAAALAGELEKWLH
jgi:acyl-CoA synthetase (AMP-forming)/AMP-acid ligase II